MEDMRKKKKKKRYLRNGSFICQPLAAGLQWIFVFVNLFNSQLKFFFLLFFHSIHTNIQTEKALACICQK